MDNVEKAVADDFAKWREEKGRNDTSKDEISADMADYMEEVFQINNTGSPEAANILDILNTMVASDVDQSVDMNGVRENTISCAGSEEANAPTLEGKNSRDRLKRTKTSSVVRRSLSQLTSQLSILLCNSR